MTIDWEVVKELHEAYDKQKAEAKRLREIAIAATADASLAEQKCRKLEGEIAKLIFPEQRV